MWAMNAQWLILFISYKMSFDSLASGFCSSQDWTTYCIYTREMQFLEIASVVAIMWRLTCLSAIMRPCPFYAHIWRSLTF